MIGLRRQPRGLVRINKANPIAKGLVCVFIGTSAFDPITGKRFVNVGKNRGYATNGTVLDAGVGQAKMTFTGPNLNTGSMFALATSFNATAEQVILEIGPDGAFVAGVRGIRFNGGKFGTYTRNFTSLDTPSSVYAYGVPMAVGATYAGTAGAIYVGGKQVNTGALAEMTSSASIFNVGGITGQTSYNLLGHVAVAFVWSRALQPIEMASISANPYQLFLDAAELEDDYLRAAVPNTYTLTASPGTFGLSGAASSLRVSRKLASGNGSFVLTGSSATLRAGRRVVSATGVITLSANVAGLTTTRKLPALGGAFVLAGSGATLKATRRLAAAAGAFSLAGGSAQLVYTPAPQANVIVAGTGQLMLSGAAVGMRVTRRLQAAPGSFALGGSAVAINYTAPTGAVIDISKISPARIVVFEGSGSRVVCFEGCGTRVTPFAGSGSRVTPFDGSGARTVRFE